TALVPRDRLFVLPLPPSSPRAQEGEALFRDAFNDVWGRLPDADRQRLLAYWRAGYQPIPRDADPARWPRPLIRLVEGGSSLPATVTDRIGHALNFPLAVIAAGPTLRAVIAGALAEVTLYASRRFWALVERLLELPFARWEHRQGAAADDAAGDRVWARLEQAHARAHARQVAGILRQWGFGNPSAPPGR